MWGQIVEKDYGFSKAQEPLDQLAPLVTIKGIVSETQLEEVHNGQSGCEEP